MQADECIRQMEWARRIGFTEMADQEGRGDTWDECGCDVREWGEHMAGCRKNNSLTLAPEDFKP